VQGGEARTTNLPWTVRASDLAAATGVPVTLLINDFEAVGHALGLLGPADLVTLQDGEPVEHGPIALIGPGTGLGQGVLIWDSGRYGVHPSEGGHATFAARSEVEWGLSESLARRFGHVSWERVVSGPGLVCVYEYLASTPTRKASASALRGIEHDDPAAVITRHGVAGTDPVAVEALSLFVGALGAQAGNLALTVLATGGVFLAGGIAPRIVDRLKTAAFLDPFRQKGRLEPLLARIPVHVIVNPDVGLLGAAAAAAREKPEG
jgi:glucokinase